MSPTSAPALEDLKHKIHFIGFFHFFENQGVRSFGDFEYALQSDVHYFRGRVLFICAITVMFCVQRKRKGCTVD